MKHNYIILIVITAIIISSNVWAAGSGSKKYVACICTKTVNLMYTNGCKKMLTPYSEQLNNDLCLTTLIALNISLKHATYFAKKVKRLSKTNDCVGHLEAAMGYTQDSFDQMNDLGKGGPDEDLAFEISNVQTWMSSAMTELNTCQDDQINAVLLRGTRTLMKVFSNTLALVNSLANPELHPQECGGT